jgi:Arc/MetJ-type ribon-helix-helix transcriptional regulator
LKRLHQNEGREWKEWYKESLREWKERYRSALQEWKDKYQEWKTKAKSEEAFPHLPPMPPIPPLHSISSSRTNVVASRIGTEQLQVIDMLIEAGVFGTRSEAVAYLVNEGMKARQDILDKVSSALREIRGIRKKAEEQVRRLKEDIGVAEPQVEETASESVEPRERKRMCFECGKDLTKLPDDISVCPYCGTEIEED